MAELTPWMSIAGGILIGLSAMLQMAVHRRIAEITGNNVGRCSACDR